MSTIYSQKESDMKKRCFLIAYLLFAYNEVWGASRPVAWPTMSIASSSDGKTEVRVQEVGDGDEKAFKAKLAEIKRLHPAFSEDFHQLLVRDFLSKFQLYPDFVRFAQNSELC